MNLICLSKVKLQRIASLALDGVGCYFFYNAKLSSIKSNQAVL
nr:MAG TPA: hypothetical protein [Bacteriophage sp.]